MNKSKDKYLEYIEKPAIECSDVESLYMDLQDRELPLSLAGRLEDHIDYCEHCQKEIAETEILIGLAKDCFKAVPMPEDVRTRLHQRLNVELGLSLP